MLINFQFEQEGSVFLLAFFCKIVILSLLRSVHLKQIIKCRLSPPFIHYNDQTITKLQVIKIVIGTDSYRSSM